MGKGLVREINKYLGNLSGKKDWQANKIYSLEHGMYRSQDVISPGEASRIVKKLERHWGILVNQIYPEIYKPYHHGTMGEAWLISRKGVAVNIPLQHLRPYTIVHEVSHGISESCRQYYSQSIREPGHGPLWCGIYAYNLKLTLGIDMYSQFEENGIRFAEETTVEKVRDRFINPLH